LWQEAFNFSESVKAQNHEFQPLLIRQLLRFTLNRIQVSEKPSPHQKTVSFAKQPELPITHEPNTSRNSEQRERILHNSPGIFATAFSQLFLSTMTLPGRKLNLG